MKRTLNLIIFNLIFTLNVNLLHAQVIKDYGIQLGITSANQVYKGTGFMEEGEQMQRRIGIIVSAYIEWSNLSYLFMITQVEYIQKGMRYEHYIYSDFGHEQIGKKIDDCRLDYLSLPIYVKLILSESEVSPYIIAGPRFDYLFNYNSDVLNYVFEEFKKYVFGGMLGLGVEIDLLSFTTPSIEIRYNMDFTNSYKEEGKEAKNNTFDIRLGFTF